MVFRAVTWIITVMIGAVSALCENAPVSVRQATRRHTRAHLLRGGVQRCTSGTKLHCTSARRADPTSCRTSAHAGPLVLELGIGPGHVPCPRGHVQAAPPGLQDRRGPRPVVAGHQRHPPGVPPVGDPDLPPHTNIHHSCKLKIAPNCCPGIRSAVLLIRKNFLIRKKILIRKKF